MFNVTKYVNIMMSLYALLWESIGYYTITMTTINKTMWFEINCLLYFVLYCELHYLISIISIYIHPLRTVEIIDSWIRFNCSKYYSGSYNPLFGDDDGYHIIPSFNSCLSIVSILWQSLITIIILSLIINRV